jgi:ABC-2 type transport system permease protein
MRKLWLIAVTTYKQQIRSGTFLFLTFGLPVLMVIAGAVPFLAASRGTELDSFGYVDQSGKLSPVGQISMDDHTYHFQSFPDEPSAKAAFRQGEIDGYLVIPTGYLEGEAVSYFANDNAGEGLDMVFEDFLRRALLPQVSSQTMQRLNDPAKLTYVASQSGERVAEGPALIIHFALPAVLAVLFGLAVMFGIGQLGAAVVREKDQRAMEIVITSLRPSELVAGKILGMTLVSMTQLGIWMIGGTIALTLALWGSVDLSNLVIPWSTLFWAVLLTVPGYFLFAALAAGVGIIAGESQQAQQLAGMLGFVGLLPLWMAGLFLEAPNSPALVVMTFFPLTAPSVTLLRMTFTAVPVWQLTVSFLLLIASLLAAVWAVTRIFRTAMLMYGKAMRPQEIWKALLQA